MDVLYASTLPFLSKDSHKSGSSSSSKKRSSYTGAISGRILHIVVSSDTTKLSEEGRMPAAIVAGDLSALAALLRIGRRSKAKEIAKETIAQMQALCSHNTLLSDSLDLNLIGALLYASILAYFACCSMNSLRGSTSSPISIEKILSASAAFSMVTWRRSLFSGSIVVSQSCSASISPRPL